MAVLLEQLTIPDEGVAQVKVNRSFRVGINGKNARCQVNEWLLAQVSCMIGAEEPTLAIGERIVWRVPAIFYASHLGAVGQVATIEVDVQTGEMDRSPEQKAHILQAAERLAQKMPSYTPRTKAQVATEGVAENLQFTPIQPQGDPLDLI